MVGEYGPRSRVSFDKRVKNYVKFNETVQQLKFRVSKAKAPSVWGRSFRYLATHFITMATSFVCSITLNLCP